MNRSISGRTESTADCADKLCALVIICANSLSEKQFLAIEDGVREPTQSWREVLLALKTRGLNAPKLVIGDGAMGFWAALDETFLTTKQQRCWVYKANNVANYLPNLSQPKARKMLRISGRPKHVTTRRNLSICSSKPMSRNIQRQPSAC